jgi:endo-1,4-beta-D-glucanase Y
MKKTLFQKRKSIFLISGILLCLIAAGCALPEGGTRAKAEAAAGYTAVVGRALASTTGVLPDFRYPYGLEYAYNETDAYLLGEYNDWKAHYVTASGAGGFLRVQRDKATDYDTVSEGMGYGMLLAVFFNDRATFDGLYKYTQAHPENDGLMHWMVNKNNENISEFGLKVPHGKLYMHKSYWDKVTKVYVDSKVDKSVVTNPDYLPVNGSARYLGSATDADVDMAAALCFAANRWGSNGSVNYFYEAAKNIKRILTADVKIKGSTVFLKNGTSWGDTYCWNPSYFTPAWIKVFKQLITDNKTTLNSVFDGKPDTYIKKCDDVIDAMYTEMAKIDAVNGTQGLYPDWCDTSAADGSVKKSTGSDRMYYLDEDGDGAIDDLNGDGKITDGDSYNMMSFNYYYDAVRVPWRIAVDYSWFGDTRAQKIIDEIGDFFKGKVTTLVDGYAIDGGAWKKGDRDGFNNATGGASHSVTFIAMNACASLASGDAGYASSFYNEVKSNKENYAGDYNYYGNCLRMMSLLYMSGRFINLADLSGFKLARKTAQMQTVGPLTIDLAYTDFSVYGLTHCDVHDRAKLYNSDGSGYSNMGAGQKDSMVDEIMISGYAAWVGDIICGLKTLRLRQSFTGGNVMARGDTEGTVFRTAAASGTIVKNMNKDPGCMDFSVDITKFNSSTGSTAITVDGGTTVSRDPGTYGMVDIRDRGTLNLKSGYYYFYSLLAGTDVKINFDTTTGAVVVCIFDEMRINSRTVISGDASEILFISGVQDGGKGPYIAPQVKWKGTLIAPRTGYLNVDIGNDGSAEGAFWGNKVVIHQDTRVYFVPFDWESLPSDSSPGQTPPPGTPCSNPTSVSVPFTKDGAGEYCWTLGTTPSYINSWNLEELTINGEDFTNRWAAGSALPGKVNGLYYIHYRGNYGWSHCEVR